jgi:hypothetical protein
MILEPLKEHVSRSWPQRRIELFSWTLGPIEAVCPGFLVAEAPPLEPRDPWTYVSLGASTVDEAPCEFCLLAPERDARHVETLAMVAHLQIREGRGLAIGRALNLGRPWCEGAQAQHLLVSLPYALPPGVEWCDTARGPVRFLWLLPITQAERDYLDVHGLEALEKRLEAKAPNVVKARRRSVV